MPGELSVDAKNLVGSTLDGRYEVTRVIGQGGMGAVYEATHAGTGRRVAVKVISTGDLTKDAALVGRFQREAKAAGAIATQHICGVLDTGTDASTGWPYMVMELMEGEDVQQLLRRVGPISAELALRICAQACLGLAKAHEAHVVHRDIKPANLFLAKGDGGNVVIKLLDFGIAKVKMEHASETGDAGLTRTGTMLGSPLYMSPEQARGVKTIDHRADLWSLGVVLYELLCGRTPFHHIDALGELIIAICSEPPRPVQDFATWVTPEVAAIVHKALKANVAERYQSANDMLEDIRALLPNGTQIDESMLVSLSETQRANIAKRLSITPPPPEDNRASNVPAQSVPPPPQNAGTTAGLAAPTERHPQLQQPSNAKYIVAGVALSLAIGGFAAYRFTAKPEAVAGVAAANTPSTAAPESTAGTTVNVTPASAPAPTVAPSPETRTVRLVVKPEDAIVTVDGTEAKVSKKGWVEISGTLGSVHTVKLKSGKDEYEDTVVVADGGALPPMLELKKGAGVVKGPGTAAPNKGGGGTTTAAPANTTPKGIDTSFQ